MYDDYDYEELDNNIVAETPASFQQITKETKKVIIQKIQNEKPVLLLDIATGRGELFQELLLHISAKTQIICTDLSFQVLKYDRLKAKKINPNAKVNYIACDATRLPFNSSSIDMAVSFFGIANML